MVEQEYPGVRLIRNNENRGFCAANNQGIQASDAEFVALLNNDAEAAPGWLEALLHALEARPDYGMAASKILVWEDARRIDKAGHLIYPDGQNRGRGSGEPDRGQYDRIEETLWPDGCAALYRREMLDQIGGFDEDFFAYADDAELGLRARIAGWRCVYAPAAVVRHHRGATLGLGSARRLEADRTKPRAAGFEAVPGQPALVKSAILRGACCLRTVADGAGPGRSVALSRRAGQTSHCGGVDSRRPARRSCSRRAYGVSVAASTRSANCRRRRLRELILGNRISLRELSGQSTANREQCLDHCPACESVEFQLLFTASDRLYQTTSDEFQVVECKRCRLMQLAPRPTPAELEKYYPKNYWFTAEGTAASQLEETYRRFVLRDHIHFVERALKESEESGLVLDVGCGGGLFLGMLRIARLSGGGARFFDRCGARGLEIESRSGYLRSLIESASCAGELRGGDDVSRARASVRSALLS